MAGTGLVVINDSTIRALLQDPRATELLPCLAASKKQLSSVSPGNKNCGRCAAAKQRIASNAVRAAKTCIRGAQGTQLQKIKEVLGAKKLRVVLTQPGSKSVEYTF